MNGGDDKKNMKLNMNAQEYKPKSYGQPGQGSNVQNPYAMSNMYDPYGGMYNGNMMYGQNVQGGYNQAGQYMGGYNNQFTGYYDPNMMGMDPNMMMDGGYQNQQNMQNKASGGIPGLGGKSKKVATSVPTTNQPGFNNPQQINFKPNQMNQPGQQVNKPKEVPKEVKKQSQPSTTTTKKPANTQVKKDESKVNKEEIQVSEVTSKVNEIDININEPVLEIDSKEGKMIEIDPIRKPVTIVFIGHVDAGKSTISGSILYKTGQIDERTIDKYKREAKTNNRESWFMAYIMDINDEEKERGKTFEVGKAFFETANKRFTILDAPGHASFVPNMLQGACQADYAGLVISAKVGEFEAGFEKDGRTKEHALLAKSLGIHKLVVIVNKMDEDSVKWSKDRYDQIKKDLSVFLKGCGYNLEKQVFWLPMSGLTGEGLMDPISTHKCPWYEGPTLLDLLDSLELPQRNESGAVRVPILDRYKETGVYLLGKIESGTVKYGATYTLMPSRLNFEVAWLFDTKERGVPYALPGESIRVSRF
jgi:peptide chain release factor subunit 3